MKSYILNMKPMPAPRMTQQDRWGKRPVVIRYKAFRQELVFRAKKQGLVQLPAVMGFEFVFPMPPSWSKRKKDEYRGQIHQQRPDLDNLIKAVKDSMTYGSGDDSHMGTYLFAQKKWGDVGRITLVVPEPKTDNWVEHLIKRFTNLVLESTKNSD